MKEKIGILVQARMGSRRLPGKVLKPVLGKPLLVYLLERLRRVSTSHEIIVATTIDSADQAIADVCQAFPVSCFRGSQEDVVLRYYDAAVAHKLDVIVRITADGPLIDPEVVEKTLRFYLEHPLSYDYVSNYLERTYPRGMDCEVFPFRVLKEVHEQSSSFLDREHVSTYIYRNPHRYRLGNVAYKENQSFHRWNVDTQEDYELVQKVIESLYLQNPKFSLEDCLALIKTNPEWSDINRRSRKKVYGV